MKLLIAVAGAVALILPGVSNLRMGLEAIKKDEKAIGAYNPKSGVVTGPLLIVAGIVIFVVGVLRPILD